MTWKLFELMEHNYKLPQQLLGKLFVHNLQLK
jgi:hypothetical protein